MSRLTLVAAFAALTLSLTPAFAAAPPATPAAPAAGAAAAANPLRNPAAFNEQAPATFKARFETTKGDIVIEVTRAWAPNGADRFYNLVKSGYFNDARFFRVLTGFMAQFGINADPQVSAAWRTATLRDDTVTQSNKRGFVTYATGGPNTRTTQIFINYDDNSELDRQGFSPFGRVISGMEVADKLYADYGEGAPRGRGPDQQLIQLQGNEYLNKAYPMLDYIKKATIEP